MNRSAALLTFAALVACGSGGPPAAPIVASVPPAPAEPTTPPAPPPAPTTTDAPAPPAAQTKPVTPQPAPLPTTKPGKKLTKAEALALQAESMQMTMISSVGTAASVQPGNPNDSPPVDLNGAASGGIVSPGPGTPPKVAGPKGEVHVGGTTATVPVPNGDRVVAGLRARFRFCYQQGLNSDPSMSGKLIVTIRIEPNGEVATASTNTNAGISPAVVSCVERVLKTPLFESPGGSGSTMNVPMTFVVSK